MSDPDRDPPQPPKDSGVNEAVEGAENEGMPPPTAPEPTEDTGGPADRQKAENQVAPAAGESPAPTPVAAARAPRLGPFAERPEEAFETPRETLRARSRRDFLIFTGGLLATAIGGWWLLPDATRGRLVGMSRRESLDSLASRVGLSRARREQVLDGGLTFDDDVSEALYSKDRRVRTYRRDEITPLRNNYHGRTPGPEFLANWSLSLAGLASGGIERLSREMLLQRFPLHEQVTRLVCVEGWSAVAWWGGIRFADLLSAFPPAPGARWAAMRSSISLDGAGRPEPYYVSIDLGTARHPQTLLATHQNGQPLTLAHGAPLRLLAPVKLGLKNIKGLTDITYTAVEPPDFWNERGYSKYDGL